MAQVSPIAIYIAGLVSQSQPTNQKGLDHRSPLQPFCDVESCDRPRYALSLTLGFSLVPTIGAAAVFGPIQRMPIAHRSDSRRRRHPDGARVGTVRATGKSFEGPFALRLTVEKGRITRHHLYQCRRLAEPSVAQALAWYAVAVPIKPSARGARKLPVAL